MGFFYRLASIITTLSAFPIVLLGMSAQVVNYMTLGVLPAPLVWISTLGLIYASLLFISWPYVLLIMVMIAGFGVVGSPVFMIFGPVGGKPPKAASSASSEAEETSSSSTFAFESLGVLMAPIKLIGQVLLFILVICETIFGSLFRTITGNFMGNLENKQKRSKASQLLWEMMFRGDTTYVIPDKKKFPNNFKNERWIHINGIQTELKHVKESCECMYNMFGRPVTAIHNPTDGMFVDLLECIAGKTGLLEFGEIEPRQLLIEKLGEELRSAKANKVDKVVLIAHSQGTIISGNAVSYLANESGPEMKKLVKELLEVYIFAGCAHKMPSDSVKYLENLSNQGDSVAWLAHLFPIKGFWRDVSFHGILYSGDEHVEFNFGHSLIDHYLTPMCHGKFAKSKLATDYMLKSIKSPAKESTTLLS